MKNIQMTADESKVKEPVIPGELRPFCACRQNGGNLECSYFSACSYWRQLNERTVKNSWLDRFLRAFVATRVQGRVFSESMLETPTYRSVLFTPFEGKFILKDLKKMIYSLHEKYSHPMALYVEGYQVREIAEILEISFVTVLMRIAYARKRLVSIMHEHPLMSLKIVPPSTEEPSAE